MVRRGDLPQATGKDRPCGMPALEDTRVPLACAKLLPASDAPDFRECREGDRPGRGAWEAVRALPVARPYGRYGSLVEADSQGCCDQMDHAWLLDMLRVRSADRALLKLSRQWLKAGGVGD